MRKSSLIGKPPNHDMLVCWRWGIYLIAAGLRHCRLSTEIDVFKSYLEEQTGGGLNRPDNLITCAKAEAAIFANILFS